MRSVPEARVAERWRTADAPPRARVERYKEVVD
jgi:hypothetical protein